MKIRIKNIFFTLLMVFTLSGVFYSQSTRSLINDGVDLYHKGKINDAEVNFKKGLKNSPKNLEANFNLGDAFYKNQRYDEAIDAFQKSLSLSNDKNYKSKIYHNIGNSFLKQKKFDESIESYKNALKLNPNDEQTKYNLSYALQQKKDNKNDKNNKNKDKDKKDKDKNDPNKDQNKNDNNKNDKDKNKDQNNPQNKDKNNPQNNPEQNPAKDKQNKMSKEQAKQILNALMNNEKELQKKLRKQKGKVVKTEKDW